MWKLLNAISDTLVISYMTESANSINLVLVFKYVFIPLILLDPAFAYIGYGFQKYTNLFQ